MTPEKWDKIAAIFQVAHEKPPDQRATYLDQACGEDASLRSEVEKLLREDAASGSFLVKPPFSDPALRALLEKEPGTDSAASATSISQLLGLTAGGSADETPEASEPGKIGHYTLIQKLGQGGMGSVYKAWDHSLDRLVALKFLSPHLYANEEMKARFLQEARTTSALDHPNICTIYSIEETGNGRIFIVMAFYEGETLRTKIDKAPLDPSEAIGLLTQVCRGLEKAHSVGIVHRDLKPANVILTPDGVAKVLDFGIAKLGGGEELTRPGTTVGTVSYMSPEQARGKPVDHRTDIWALGVLLYEMLTGHKPFDADDDIGRLYAIVHEEPRPPETAGEAWPAGLIDILRKALEKDPARRYQSAAELATDLKAVLGGAPPEAAASSDATAGTAPSIVVLPFANLSSDTENDYFSDGLTEELINSLSRIGGIQVVSRTTAFQFRNQATDIREVGRKLNVSSVLEGSVRTAGSKVRITARLVNVADGYQLWSGRFDRELGDIFAVQDEIARVIVDTLEVRLKGEEPPPRAKPPTADQTAYQLYLKGRHHSNHWTQIGLERGIELFREALSRDTSFAQARVGLAEAYLLRGYWGLVPPNEAWPQVRSAASAALELDEALGEARAALGVVHAVQDWDWERARAEFGEALRLNPREPLIRSWYAALYLLPKGELEEAREENKRCLELDPLSPAYHAAAAWTYSYLGRHEEALRHAREGLELAPTFLESHWALSAALLNQGKVEEALRALESTYGISRENSFTLAQLVRAMMAAGRETDARRFQARMQALTRNRYVSPTHLAWAHIALGEFDEAFRQLDAALEIREVMLLYLKTSPMFDAIRAEKRYEALLGRIGLAS